MQINANVLNDMHKMNANSIIDCLVSRKEQKLIKKQDEMMLEIEQYVNKNMKEMYEEMSELKRSFEEEIENYGGR